MVVRRSRASAALLACGVLGCGFMVAACSDDSSSTSTSSSTSVSGGSTDGGATTLPGERVLPIVDQIPVAIAALEAQTGAPVEYFEINATAQLVNLFVALNDGAVAQPWLFVGGELTSSEGQQASGGTFFGAEVAFDPATIFDPLLAEVPGIQVESFYVHGDGAGNLLYGVLATSERGGGLDIVLGQDGSVLSVDPLTEGL